MLNVNEDNRIDGREIYQVAGVKTPFGRWVKRCIEYATLKEGMDFWTNLSVNAGSREK